MPGGRKPVLPVTVFTLLAEAAKEEGPDIFEALNEGLFRAYLIAAGKS